MLADEVASGAVVEIDDTVRRSIAAQPHGYDMRYSGSGPQDPELNKLISSAHRDPRSRTPYHRYVRLNILKITTDAWS